MKNSSNILVIGGTGKTGRKVAEGLQKRGQKVRIGGRNSKPAFDWAKPQTWEKALEGMDKVYIVFYPDLAVPGALQAIQQLATMARTVGVKKAVLLSGKGEREAERCEQVAFSHPTYVVGEAFAVKKGNPKNITDYETISENHDAKVGLIAGTVEYNYALVTGIPADRAPLYRNFDKAIEALEQGEVDAVGLTALTAQDLVDGKPGLEATAQFFPELDGEVVKGYGGFAFRKEDLDLRDAFNAELADFVGSKEHWELVERFGFTPDMAPDKTAEELCQN